ncbi:hypothetical protein BSKO_00441 [Bryopsis sp. KO-2023]|nr:hypothetical protein BSKO_00441 [Bryopsis sp. KO-2023]
MESGGHVDAGVGDGGQEGLGTTAVGVPTGLSPDNIANNFSTAEQVLVATSGPSLYARNAQSLSCSSLLRLSDMQPHEGVDVMSRSLTCLGLAGTIPEGKEGEEESDQPVSAPFQQGHHFASRSATDLAGMGFVHGEEDVFASTGGMDLDAGMGGERVSPFKVSPSPSRTIIVGNVPAAVDDEHLTQLFQAYGDIQSMRTEYKAHGVVVVSYFDLRSALNSKRQLEGVTLSEQQPVTIQFSASGTTLGNFGEQGTLLIFNVDPMTDTQELAHVFSAYGAIKQIQDVPDKKNHKLIEYYDIRHANLAMAAINKAVVGGSKVPNMGMRQVASHANLGQQLHQESDLDPSARSWDESRNAEAKMKSYLSAAQQLAGPGEGSPPPPGLPPTGGGLRGMTRSTSTGTGLADLGVPQGPSSAAPSPLSPGIAGGALPLTAQLAKGLQISDSASSLGSRVFGQGLVPNQGILPGGLEAQFEGLGLSQRAGLMGYSSTGVQPLSAATYGLNPALSQAGADAGLGVRGPPPGFGDMGQASVGLARGLSSSASVGSGLDNYGQNQAAVNAAYASLQQANLLGTGGTGNAAASLGLGVPGLDANLGANLWGSAGNVYQGQANQALTAQAGMNLYETLAKLQQAGVTNIPALLSAQVNSGLPPSGAAQNNFWSQQTMANNAALVQQAIGTGVLSSLVSPGVSAPQDMSSMSKSASSPALSLVAEDGREHRETHKSGGRLSRRNVDPILEAERRSQQQRLYALDMDKVRKAEDKRTTLMIKNIPNKYTQKMLLASVDEVLKGKYDFFYLPIDFKNKCNVGYGFINVHEPIHIVPVMERFHNKKWERFNSEKVCCVTYARIQGKNALVNHFQNSSLMHEDKKHRPVLFYSEGPNFGDPEPFPVGPNVRPRITFKDRDFRSRERSGFWS